MLEWGVDWVLSSQVCSQFHVEFVEFVHFFQRQLHLASPVCRYKSGMGGGGGGGGGKDERWKTG